MYTNETNIPLSMALWLVSDDYDYNPDPFTISATTILKPIRSLILSRKIDGEVTIDLSTMVNMRMGTAIHDGIEKAWRQGPEKIQELLNKLNVPRSVQKRLVVNPEIIEDNMIPIFLENRAAKRIGKWTVTGKYDFVMDYTVEDHKSTGVYNYIRQSNAHKYKLQASIYRWLNPEKINRDYMMINYLFTDWSKLSAVKDKDYPQHRILAQKIPLLSIEETETFIKGRLNQLEQLADVSQKNLPRCTPSELWQDDPKFKYFKNPNKTSGRSTRTLDSLAEAEHIKSQNGGVGVIIPAVKPAKFCQYCPGKQICSQAEELEAAGLLAD